MSKKALGSWWATQSFPADYKRHPVDRTVVRMVGGEHSQGFLRYEGKFFFWS
jgi:hypothetical protein